MEAIKTHTIDSYESVRAWNRIHSGKYYVVTFGCQQNEADSERIRGMAEQMGYAPTDVPEEASLILMNTCAIRQRAELKALSALGRFKKVRADRSDAIIGICGCMAAEAHVVENVKKSFPYVNFTLEPTRLADLPTLVARALNEHTRSFVIGEDDGSIATEGLPVVRSVPHRAWVSIMYGCNNFCSYCIVPYVRGRERSRSSSAILDECRALIADGCREITLLGQNVNSYRSDMDFATLIGRIAALEGDFIVRFMTSHPKDVSPDLIETMRRHPKIAPSFHLPLQAGSDRILREMNRTYDTAHYLDIVRRLRAAVPEIAITTDIIVGFPGETEEDFEGTMRVVEEVGFDGIFSFIYSPREGTRAAKMEDRVPASEQNRRMERLLEAAHRIALERNLPYVGRTVRVLVDSIAREGGYIGRTMTNKLVRFSDAASRIGSFVSVRIEKASPYDLIGTACP